MKEKLNNLLNCENRADIIKCLQEINELFLRNYIIDLNGIIIEPIQVEAYYYNEKQNFTDNDASHKNLEQKNNYGKLYFHKKGRGGVDICLSDSDDYYLSLLLKTSRIGAQVFSQIELQCVLEKLENKIALLERKIFKTKRVGLNETDADNEELGATVDINLANLRGFGKERTVDLYIKEHKISEISEINEFEKRYLGYNRKIKDK